MENNEEIQITPEFQLQALSDGWMKSYIELVDAERRKGDPLGTIRTCFGGMYTDRFMRRSLNIPPQRRDIYAALDILIAPWIQSRYKILPQNIQIIQVSRMTGYSSDKVFDVLNKNPYEIILGGQIYIGWIEESLRPKARKRIRFDEEKKREKLLERKLQKSNEIRTQLQRANRAYQQFTELGPFYGKGEKGKTPPTFRIGTNPLELKLEVAELLQQIGNDVLKVAQCLPKLRDFFPDKALLFEIPISFRIDGMINGNGQIKFYEVEIDDGADALMVGEQLAYDIQTIDVSTAAYLVKSIIERTGKQNSKIFWITDASSPYYTNVSRMAEFIDTVSSGNIVIRVRDQKEIGKDNWSEPDGIINGSGLSLQSILGVGIPQEKILSAGLVSALGNKEVFPLLFDESLQTFWEEQIGVKALQRLQSVCIPTQFIKNRDELEKCLTANQEVLKISWAGDDLALIECSRGVFGPWSKQDDFSNIQRLLGGNLQFIRQPYIQPAKIRMKLRKNRGNALEEVEWYNRICVKYVIISGKTYITAVEATLGPKVVPAGRNCCFIPVVFVE